MAHRLRDRGGCAVCVGYAIIWNVPTQPMCGKQIIFEPNAIQYPNGCAVLWGHRPFHFLANTLDGRVELEADEFGLLFAFAAEDIYENRQHVGRIRLQRPGASIGLTAGNRAGKSFRVPGGRVYVVPRATINEISITTNPRQPATYVKVAGHGCPPDEERQEYEAEERRLATMQKQLTDRLPLASRVRNWQLLNRLARLRAEARLAFV